jgi:hypothetical protein
MEKTPRSWKSWLDTAVGIAVVLTLAVALSAYFDARASNRIAATLGYIDRYRSDPVSKAVLDLEDAYASPEAQALMTNQAPGDRDGWARRSLEFHHDKSLTKKVRMIADYYDDLYFCLAHSICDMDLALTVVDQDAQTFFVMSRSLLDEMNALQINGARGCGLSALENTIQARMDSADNDSGYKGLKIEQHACPGS